MPDPLRNLSQFAEDSMGDIRLIVYDYRRTRRSTEIVSAGRFGATGQVLGDRTTQFAVANIVAVVERYAERTLLYAGCQPNGIKTWSAKVKAWQATFGHDIEAPEICPSFAAMRGYYEARNAILHRRGELTDSQRRRGVYSRLKAANVERVGFHIVVTPDSVPNCAEVCVRCVKELDATV